MAWRARIDMSSTQDWSSCSFCDRPIDDIDDLRLLWNDAQTVSMPLCVRCFNKRHNEDTDPDCGEPESRIEHARDDDFFDETAIEHAETYIEGMDESDLTDLAEVMIDCKHGNETWHGERIPTKAERNPTQPQAKESAVKT